MAFGKTVNRIPEQALILGQLEIHCRRSAATAALAAAARNPAAVPMDGCGAFTRMDERPYPFTASFRGLPALNLGCVDDGI